MAEMVTDAAHAVLDEEWREAFGALRAAGLESDADHPVAARYRAASNAVNHANRSRDFAIATGQPTTARYVGGAAFAAGEPRRYPVPAPDVPVGSPAAAAWVADGREWYAGYDAANLAAPVEMSR